MKKGLLSAERVKLMESWEHSGFNIDALVRIGAILLHVALWDVAKARPPPVATGENAGFEYVPCED